VEGGVALGGSVLCGGGWAGWSVGPAFCIAVLTAVLRLMHSLYMLPSVIRSLFNSVYSTLIASSQL